MNNNRRNFNILSGNKPLPHKPQSNGHNIWPSFRASSHHESSEGENEPPNSHSTVPVDVFQEREGAGGMRVGKDYQAKITPYIPSPERNVQADADRALLVWSPSEILTDQEVENYLEMAKDKFQYSGEQALGLLYWHRYDVSKALQDLGNFTPHPEEWTIEDKVLFEQAFQFHGKAFDRIRQMLPDKSMSSLIRYYYKWKKYKNKTSVMDRQVKKFSQEDGGEDSVPTNNSNIVGLTGSNNNNNNRHPSIMQGQQNANFINLQLSRRNMGGNVSDSESDDKHNGDTGKFCSNCGIPCTELHPKDSMCNTCFLYWKKTGDFRPLTGPLRRGGQVLGALRQRRSPPKGMYINHDDLITLARSAPQAENVTLQGLEKEVLDHKCLVQASKQEIEILKREMPNDGISQFKPKEGTSSTNNRVNSRWTQDELLLAAQGVRRYGREFQKIAEVIGTKTEAHLKVFYANYRRRFGLDDLVKEYQLENSDEIIGLSDNETPTTDSKINSTHKNK